MALEHYLYFRFFVFLMYMYIKKAMGGPHFISLYRFTVKMSVANCEK